MAADEGDSSSPPPLPSAPPPPLPPLPEDAPWSLDLDDAEAVPLTPLDDAEAAPLTPLGRLSRMISTDLIDDGLIDIAVQEATAEAMTVHADAVLEQKRIELEAEIAAAEEEAAAARAAEEAALAEAAEAARLLAAEQERERVEAERLAAIEAAKSPEQRNRERIGKELEKRRKKKEDAARKAAELAAMPPTRAPAPARKPYSGAVTGELERRRKRVALSAREQRGSAKTKKGEGVEQDAEWLRSKMMQTGQRLSHERIFYATQRKAKRAGETAAINSYLRGDDKAMQEAARVKAEEAVMRASHLAGLGNLSIGGQYSSQNTEREEPHRSQYTTSQTARLPGATTTRPLAPLAPLDGILSAVGKEQKAAAAAAALRVQAAIRTNTATLASTLLAELQLPEARDEVATGGGGKDVWV